MIFWMVSRTLFCKDQLTGKTKQSFSQILGDAEKVILLIVFVNTELDLFLHFLIRNTLKNSSLLP